MDLPTNGAEGVKVISVRHGRPRKTVAAPDASRSAHAKGAVMIGDDDLGYGAEHVIARGFESEQCRHYYRRQAGADKIRQATFGGREGESLVGSSNKLAGEGTALGFVCVQKSIRRLAGQDGLQFPCKIDGIAKSPRPVFMPWPPAGL
jgi:hypothetical protein